LLSQSPLLSRILPMDEQVIKVRGLHCQLDMSGRGFVYLVRKQHRVFVEMDPDLKESISRDEDAWRREMLRLKDIAICKMRKLLGSRAQ
jgi:hypothetical protein